MRESRELTQEEKAFVERLASKLPPCLARSEIRTRLGGMISPYTVRNADNAGVGPQGARLIGKRVVYETRPLLLWIVRRFGARPVISLDCPEDADDQRLAV